MNKSSLRCLRFSLTGCSATKSIQVMYECDDNTLKRCISSAFLLERIQIRDQKILQKQVLESHRGAFWGFFCETKIFKIIECVLVWIWPSFSIGWINGENCNAQAPLANYISDPRTRKSLCWWCLNENQARCTSGIMTWFCTENRNNETSCIYHPIPIKTNSLFNCVSCLRLCRWRRMDRNYHHHFRPCNRMAIQRENQKLVAC